MATGWKLMIPCTRAQAERLSGESDALAGLDPEPVIVASELDEDEDAWLIEAYFEAEPDAAAIAVFAAEVPDARPRLERLPDSDWVTLSQAGIAPVEAGRFYVHTQSNAGTPPPGAKRFRIDAGLAFGTGSHETTAGCLAMLDQLQRRGHGFANIADIGTGTGLLAFAALHLWPTARTVASDIDPISIAVTRENAALNGVRLGPGPGALALCVASGTDHPLLHRRAPYDLLIANILAGPLVELAGAFAEVMAPGGTLVLAGLLDRQQAAVARAYRRAGFRLVESRPHGSWPTLRLIRRQQLGWRRPVRASGRTSQLPGDFGAW